MLIQDLVPGADYNIVAEHALPIVLTKGTARVLSPSEPEETRNTDRSRASGTKVPVGSILVRFCWPSRRGVRTRGVRGNGMCREEEGTTEGGIQAHVYKKTQQRRTRVSASGPTGSGQISVQVAHFTVYPRA